jgi:hypothetical protein
LLKEEVIKELRGGRKAKRVEFWWRAEMAVETRRINFVIPKDWHSIAEVIYMSLTMQITVYNSLHWRRTDELI